MQIITQTHTVELSHDLQRVTVKLTSIAEPNVVVCGELYHADAYDLATSLNGEESRVNSRNFIWHAGMYPLANADGSIPSEFRLLASLGWFVYAISDAEDLRFSFTGDDGAEAVAIITRDQAFELAQALVDITILGIG